MDLGERLLGPEPMEGLRNRQCIDLTVRERDRLGGPLERTYVLDLRAHLGDRLDCDHLRTARREQPRQLAGAGGEVDHRAARPEVEALHEPFDRGGRIVGPSTLVRVGGEPEAPRIGMEIRPGSTGRGHSARSLHNGAGARRRRGARAR